MTTHTFKSADSKITYEDHGTGAPLLLLHAFPLGRAMWQAQIDTFARTQRVLVPDIRGLGDSTLGAGATSMDRYADDAAALMDHVGIARCVVVGVSLGGYIAFALHRRHPDRITGLVLANTRSLPDTPEAREARAATARMVVAQGTGTLAESMTPKLLAPAAPADLRARVHAIISANRQLGVVAALGALAERPDSTATLATILVPTLVVAGEHDALIPLEESRTMAEGLLDATFALIPDAGHLACMEQPEAFNRELADWMQQLD